LKLFLSSLPDSVFTTALHKSFVKVAELPTKKEQLEGVKVHLELLPAANRDLLIALLEFCNEVMVHEADNMMDRYNLSVVLAPTLFSRKKSWTQVKEKFFNMNGMGMEKIITKTEGDFFFFCFLLCGC
jgi:hypothetical protein